MMSSASNDEYEKAHGQPVLSVVATLYNEEESIRPLVENLISAFREKLSATTFEVVIVLNGPKDNTPKIADQLASKFSELVLIQLRENQGMGGGMLAGLRAARGQVIGFIDGDEQILAEDVANIFSIAIDDPHDIVKAVRVKRHDGIQRLIVTTTYNALFGIMFGIRNKDINGKPKVFKRRVLEALDLRATDWFLDGEFMIKAHRFGFSILEIPVVFQPRKHGSSNVRVATVIEFLKNMLEYRRGKS